MANTKIPVELSSTPGIVDNSNATAITIDSSENVGIGVSPTQKLQVKTATDKNFIVLDASGVRLQATNDAGTTLDTLRVAGNPLIFLGSGGAETARIDSSGNVLINGTSKFNGYPSGFVTQSIASGSGDLCPILELAGNRNASAGNQNAMIQFYNKTSTATEVSRISSIQGSATNSGELQFHIANAGTLAEAMRITSDGEVRVNAVPRQSMAEFNNRQNGACIEFGHENNGGQYYGTLGVFGTNGHPYIGFSTDCESSADTFTTRGVAGNIITGDIGNGSLKFMQVTSSSATGQTPVERMRIDSSGNVVVSGSSAYGADTITLGTGGFAGIRNTSGTCLELRRDSTHGDILEFQKDGSTIGKVVTTGTGNGSIVIGNDSSGIMFRGDLTGSAFIPADPATGNQTDNTLDIGHSVIRFDDVYATNGTINTSDRNEKQDIEALTDAETRVAVAAKGLLRKFRWINRVEEKGDEARIHFGIIAQDLQDAFTAEGLDAGDYAMFISTTWTDDDGVEQTRLGVRYSELLAFIIAAI